MKINEKAPYYALEATSPQTMRIYKIISTLNI